MASEYGAPVHIFRPGAYEERGERSKLSNIVGAIAVADLVRSTLGPKGMDKILQSMGGGGGEDITVTNDGATILKSLYVNNPAAQVLIDISKTQDEEVGDGTTTVAILAGELLRQAEKLLMEKVHPQTIIKGWRLATDVARKALLDLSVDHSTDLEKFENDLLNIARTTLSSKVLNQHKDLFARLSVDAIMRLARLDQFKTNPDLGVNLEYIQIVKVPGGSMADSHLEEGYLLEKTIGVGQPKRIENPKVLIANTPMDTDKIKIYGARIRTASLKDMIDIEESERKRMDDKCKKILEYGMNVFINRQLIYDRPEEFFTEHGVTAIEHADFEGIERLARVLDAEVVSTFDNPGSARLGTCKLIHEIMIGESKFIQFSGVPKGEACTVVLRGASQQILDEAERALHDALCVVSQTVRNTRVVYGGGCSEMAMAQAIERASASTEGKSALAMDAFSRALRELPKILSENAGFDAVDLVTRLRAAHNRGEGYSGLDMNIGDVADMRELGITEAYKMKLQALLSASEAAEMVLRVDDIITCAPRQRSHE